MRVLITGSRTWRNRSLVRTVLTQLRREAHEAGEEFVVIHGQSPKGGADVIADEICVLELGMTPGRDLIREPADWSRYGRAAGPVRNARMLVEHQPTVVYAFRCEGKSNGTDDMVRRARRDQIPTFVLTPDATPDA